MATMKQIREMFSSGQRVKVTNHYITRADHPCYGTNERTIAKVTTSSLWFEVTGNVEWPNRSQIEVDGSVVRLFGGGIGQKPTDLFLTIEPT